MPSFLKRFSSVATTQSPAEATTKSMNLSKNDQERRKSSLSHMSDISANSSHSASPTLSSASSLSLSVPDSPSLSSSCAPSRLQSSDALKQHPRHGSESALDQTSFATSVSKAKNRASINSLSALFHPRSRSMPTLDDPSLSAVGPTSAPSSVSKRHSVQPILNNRKCVSQGSLMTSDKGSKKSRPMSFSGLLLQHDQQVTKTQPHLPHHQKATRWANKGGIGTKNEMMVDLEASGVFVPSNAKRLRPEFVYRTMTRCADEIRNRGLDHANIFYNPAPKKVISAMLALLTDRERSDLYPVNCLRIDTVASLLLNLVSQMSEPVIPYAVMDYYFHQSSLMSTSSGSVGSASPQQGPSLTSSSGTHLPTLIETSADMSQTSIPFSASTPGLPQLLHPPLRPASPTTLAWARLFFDLPAFLDALPDLNRVILLEMLHLCAEVLEHQANNGLTMNRLVQQVAPALFSTVYDQMMLEKVVGSRRCSIHGNNISLMDGHQAETHLFSVILTRFLCMRS